MSDWSYAGFPPDQFWQMSPREHYAIMAGFAARRKDDVNLSIRQAHMTAVLGRVDKIGPVDDYLIGQPRPDIPRGQVPAGEGLAAWASVLSTMQKGA